MTNDKDRMREAFEAELRRLWAGRTDPYLRLCNDCPNTDNRTYQDTDTELAWVMWQAGWQAHDAEVEELLEALAALAKSAADVNDWCEGSCSESDFELYGLGGPSAQLSVVDLPRAKALLAKHKQEG